MNAFVPALPKELLNALHTFYCNQLFEPIENIFFDSLSSILPVYSRGYFKTHKSWRAMKVEHRTTCVTDLVFSPRIRLFLLLAVALTIFGPEQQSRSRVNLLGSSLLGYPC